ncbi:50S ribosomal protein L24 [Candidatus Woesearchaeota archaeon]|nr:MAG: 50S ribosomal protein L24 [Candidatus Woesearchaeota archaeon]
MKQEFSKSWNNSKKPSKQRKFRANAPLHTKSKFLSTHLIKELREKHGKRSVRVKKGDKVKVLRGTHRGKTGKVEKVSVKLTKVYVTGIDTIKKDGAKALYPLNPTNLMITELDLSDNKRKEKMTKK